MPTSSLRTHIRGKHLEPAIIVPANSTLCPTDPAILVPANSTLCPTDPAIIVPANFTLCPPQTQQPVALRTGLGALSLCPCRPKLQTLDPGGILTTIKMDNKYAFQAKPNLGSNTMWPGQKLCCQLSTEVEASPVSYLNNCNDIHHFENGPVLMLNLSQRREG